MEWPLRSQLIEFVCSDASRSLSDTVFAWNLRHPHNRTDEEYIRGIRQQCLIDPRPNDPTPEEIAERAAHEREAWTPQEEIKRQEQPPLFWVPPGCERIFNRDVAIRELLGDEEREATE